MQYKYQINNIVKKKKYKDQYYKIVSFTEIQYQSGFYIEIKEGLKMAEPSPCYEIRNINSNYVVRAEECELTLVTAPDYLK